MNILEKAKKDSGNKQTKDKLPFAVFVCPRTKDEKSEDYKQIFTDIISDRIQEKFK